MDQLTGDVTESIDYVRRSSKEIYEAISDQRDAPEALHILQRDIGVLIATLGSLDEVLRGNSLELLYGQTRCLQTLLQVLEGCQSRCVALEDEIRTGRWRDTSRSRLTGYTERFSRSVRSWSASLSAVLNVCALGRTATNEALLREIESHIQTTRRGINDDIIQLRDDLQVLRGSSSEMGFRVKEVRQQLFVLENCHELLDEVSDAFAQVAGSKSDTLMSGGIAAGVIVEVGPSVAGLQAANVYSNVVSTNESRVLMGSISGDSVFHNFERTRRSSPRDTSRSQKNVALPSWEDFMDD